MRTRVLYIHHGRGWGGAPKSLSLLLAALDKGQYEPFVLCIHPGKAADTFVRLVGMDRVLMDPQLTTLSHTRQEWYRLDKLSALRYAAHVAGTPRTIRRTLDHIRRVDPAIVHLNSSSLLGQGVAASRAGKNVVWHIREPLSPGHTGLRYAVSRRVISAHANAIVPISRFDGAPFLDDPRTEVVYNPVEDKGPFDRAALRSELGWSADDVIVGLVGFTPEKGLFEFLGAARRAAPLSVPLKFVIVGFDRSAPGHLIRSARREIDGAELRGRFLGSMEAPWIGFDQAPDRYMAAMDAVVVPHAIPHFSRVVLEAGMAGTAVIAYAWGGAEEIIEPGRTGVLVAPLDKDALAREMIRVAGDPAKAADMGQAARRKALVWFTPQKHAAQIEAIYARLLKRGRS